MNPTIDITFTLDQLRVLVKSLGRTRDSELRKMARIKPASPFYAEAQADFGRLDDVEAAVSNAISELVLRPVERDDPAA